MRTSEELAAIDSFCAEDPDTRTLGELVAKRDSERGMGGYSHTHSFSRDFAGLPSEVPSEVSPAMSTYEKFTMEASGMSIDALKVAKAIFNKDIVATDFRFIDEPRSTHELSDSKLEVAFRGSPRELHALAKLLRDYM